MKYSRNSGLMVTKMLLATADKSERGSDASAGSFSLTGVISSLPDFAFAGVFLIAWISPYCLGEKTVSYLMLVMLMEFINIHSSGFMGSVMLNNIPFRKKSYSVIGLGLFYTLFVGGFSLAFKVLWPLYTFWILTANRLLGPVLLGATTAKEKKLIVASWGACCMLYVVFCFVTALIPMPAFGITADVISAQNLTGEGVWIDEPYRVIAFGFFYFAGVGISEIFGHSWIAKMEINHKRKGQ